MYQQYSQMTPNTGGGYYNYPNYNYPNYTVEQSKVIYPAGPTGGYLKGRPVASLEEARAAQIDFDGSLHVFTDIGNKKIYTKQINMDGTASLHTYILEDAAEPNASTIEYVTREEFNQVLSQLHSLIESKSFSKEDEKKALSLNNF